MKYVKLAEGEKYQALDHFNMWGAKKVTAGVESKKTTISLSHFLPDGGAKMASSSRERVYFVITGSITVLGEKDEKYVLNEGDLLYIAAGEKRSVTVNNNLPATMLVMVIEV
jgi:quercetin dioxygenase-like cupin family protein